MAKVKCDMARMRRRLQTLPKIVYPARKLHTPFARVFAHAQYAQLTLRTARVLSQSMVLEHMKNDDECRV